MQVCFLSLLAQVFVGDLSCIGTSEPPKTPCDLDCGLAHKQNVSHENREHCCLPTSALPGPGRDRIDFIGRGSIVGNKST